MWYGGKERIKCPTHHPYGECDIVTGTSVDQNKFRVQELDCHAVPVTTACPIF